MTLLKFAIKNIKRKKYRSIAIITAAALAGGLIFSALVVLTSVEKSLEKGMERLGADIMVVPADYEDKGRKILLAGEPTSFYMNGKNAATIAGIQGVEKSSYQLFMTSSVLECCSMPTILLVGFDPSTDFTITPWIRYTHKVSKQDIDEITIGCQALYASEGPHMTFFGKEFKIGRSLEPTGLGFLDYSIFMTIDAARDMISNSGKRSGQPLNVRPDQISSVLVKVSGNVDIQKIAADIEKALPDVKAIATKDLITAVRRDTQLAMLGALAGGAAAWGMLLVLNGLIFSIVINERRREFGILRAMGATRMHVFRLVVSEAAILSGLGGLIGAAMGWLSIAYFQRLIIASLDDVTFTLPSPFLIGAAAAGCFILFLLTGAASAAYPAFRVSRREPDEAIKQ